MTAQGRAPCMGARRRGTIHGMVRTGETPAMLRARRDNRWWRWMNLVAAPPPRRRRPALEVEPRLGSRWSARSPPSDTPFTAERDDARTTRTGSTGTLGAPLPRVQGPDVLRLELRTSAAGAHRRRVRGRYGRRRGAPGLPESVCASGDEVHDAHAHDGADAAVVDLPPHARCAAARKEAKRDSRGRRVGDPSLDGDERACVSSCSVPAGWYIGGRVQRLSAPRRNGVLKPRGRVDSCWTVETVQTRETAPRRLETTSRRPRPHAGDAGRPRRGRLLLRALRPPGPRARQPGSFVVGPSRVDVGQRGRRPGDVCHIPGPRTTDALHSTPCWRRCSPRPSRLNARRPQSAVPVEPPAPTPPVRDPRGFVRVGVRVGARSTRSSGAAVLARGRAACPFPRRPAVPRLLLPLELDSNGRDLARNFEVALWLALGALVRGPSRFRAHDARPPSTRGRLPASSRCAPSSPGCRTPRGRPPSQRTSTSPGTFEGFGGDSGFEGRASTSAAPRSKVMPMSGRWSSTSKIISGLPVTRRARTSRWSREALRRGPPRRTA